MGKSKKDKYENLDEEFKAKIAGSDQDDKVIVEAIKTSALYIERLDECEKADLDLKEARQRAADAAAVYRDGKKECRLKIAFCRDVLKSRGRRLPGD